MNNVRREKRRDIKQIPERNCRHVTLCKRRAGIFKKAGELCVVTGAECAILCESYGGRVYAFGHPNVEYVVDKYLGDKSSSELPEKNSETDLNSPCMHEELKKQYSEISKEIEIEKSISANATGGKNDNSDNVEKDIDVFWWQQPFEDLEIEELEQYISSMEILMNKVRSRADDLRVIKSSSSMFNAKKTVNSNVTGLSDKNLADKNLIKKEDRSPDGLLDEVLAMQDPNVDDDEFNGYLDNLELQKYNVQDPNAYGNTGNEAQLSRSNDNLVVPSDCGKAVDFQHSVTDVTTQ